MVVWITGGCGFIASNFLVRYVPEHPEIRFINVDALTYAANPESLAPIQGAANYEFLQLDLTDKEATAAALARTRPDVVINFAAETHVDRSIRRPEEVVNTNVGSVLSLLEGIRGLGENAPRLIHVSTDEVYGGLGNDESTTEASPYRPGNPYSASKAAGDHLVRAYARTFGLRACITHCSNNYGPRQAPEKLIPRMIARIQAGESLPVYGEGKQRRDWLHVNDHNAAIWAVMERGKDGETYDIGGGEEMENIGIVHELCAVMASLTGQPESQYRELVTFVPDRPGHDWRYAIDSTKIRRELGWQPAVSFAEGLRTTVEWYLANPEWVAAARSRLEVAHA